MKKNDFLLKLEKLLELDANTLGGNEKLCDIETWDSLSVLSLIAFADKEFKVVLFPEDINKTITINDIIMLFGDKIEG